MGFDNLTLKQFKLLMIALCIVLVLAFAIPFCQEKIGYSTKKVEMSANKENNEEGDRNFSNTLDLGLLSMVASLSISVAYGIIKGRKNNRRIKNKDYEQ